MTVQDHLSASAISAATRHWEGVPSVRGQGLCNAQKKTARIPGTAPAENAFVALITCPLSTIARVAFHEVQSGHVQPENRFPTTRAAARCLELARAARAHVIQAARKAPNHRRTTAHVMHHRLPRRAVATAPVPATPMPAASKASRPTFDDIPRQLTPEDNVLRVDSRQARAEVER